MAVLLDNFVSASTSMENEARDLEVCPSAPSHPPRQTHAPTYLLSFLCLIQVAPSYLLLLTPSSPSISLVAHDLQKGAFLKIYCFQFILSRL